MPKEMIANQEGRMFEYLKRLVKLPAPKRGLILYARSSLFFGAEKVNFAEMIEEMVSPLVLRQKCVRFQLSNEDVVLFYQKSLEDEVAAIALKAKFFSSSTEESVKIYDVETQYKEFFEHINNVISSTDKEAELEQTNASKPAFTRPSFGARTGRDKKLNPFDSRALALLESRLRGADLANMIRRQPACVIVGNSSPQRMFDEIFVSVNDLKEMLLPDTDFMSAPWLFQRLTSTLDKRVLVSVNRHDDGSFKNHFSINLNVSTILSPDFVNFDKGITSADKGTIFLEIQPVDIFSDLSSYIMALSFVKDRGYKVCIDGITIDSLAYIDMKKLGADLLKMFWSPKMADEAENPDSDFVRNIKEIGASNFVLARIDDEKALAVGHSFGINLFQGRYIQHLLSLNPERRRVNTFYIK